MSITSDRIREVGFIHALADDAACEIEQMEKDINNLLETREREADRLDWLLSRISESERVRLVGDMDDRFSASEWRNRIDKELGLKPLSQ